MRAAPGVAMRLRTPTSCSRSSSDAGCSSRRAASGVRRRRAGTRRGSTCSPERSAPGPSTEPESPMASADTLLKEASRALGSGRVAAASAFIDQALAKKLDTNHGEALFDLGNMLAERNDPTAAVAVFERALQLFPGHPGLLINLGTQLDRFGASARAERCFREVLDRRPTEIAALANLAHLLFTQERYADALAVYDRLGAAASDAPADIWNNRGVCQKHVRDRGAEASFRRAQALAPDSPQVLANLGFLLAEQRNYAEARPLLQKARALDPSRLQVAAQCVELQLQFA